MFLIKAVNKSVYFCLAASGLAVFTLSAAFFLMGCGREDQRALRDTQRLMFLCGAAIRPPIEGAGMPGEKGIIERFREAFPEVVIETNYGASNLLLGQLKVTGTGDLFLPGDDFYVEEAKRYGLVYESRTVAWFVPVIMTAEGNPLGIESVADLAEPGVRLALADERAAAIGRIMPELFKKNGVDFQDLDNVEFTGVTAPEIAQAVDLGHVDATVVWRPVAIQYEGAGIVDIAPDKNVVSPLVIAVLKTSADGAAGVKFADFISGPEGREVFARYGYDVR